MRKLNIKKLPKSILDKAEIVGNVFDNIKELKGALLTIEKIATINNEDEKNQILTDIYKIAHAFNGTCQNPHDDWKKFERKIANELKDF